MRSSSRLILTVALSCLPAFALADAVPAAKDSGKPKWKEGQTAAKRIEWGTSSAPARAAVTDALQKIEGGVPAARWREAAQKAAEADPAFAFTHFLVGISLPGDPARAHLDKATELAAKAPEGERRYIEAALLRRAQKNDDALASFEKLAADYPGEPLVFINIGQIHIEGGRVPEARKALETALTLQPTSARALLALGNTLILAGDYDGARARFEAALTKLDPVASTAGARTGIARTYVYQGKPAEAVKSWQQAIEEYRKAPAGFPEVGLWNAMARVQLESGDPQAAIATYEKGNESVKTAANIGERDKQIWTGRLHHGRARALARMGKHKEAWEEAEIVHKMIEDGGDSAKEFLPAYHYLAGYLKLEAGEAELALEHLKQAEPEHDDFRNLLLARAYEKLGDKEKARKAYQDIVDSKDNNLERALSYPEAKKKPL
jgi:tetratricopeptide (TPR) repeat protein